MKKYSLVGILFYVLAFSCFVAGLILIGGGHWGGTVWQGLLLTVLGFPFLVIAEGT